MTRRMGSVGWGTSRRRRTWPVTVALLGGVVAGLLVVTPWSGCRRLDVGGAWTRGSHGLSRLGGRPAGRH
ncbi:hypothetical protein [Actinopolymorpha pittospori]